MVKRAEVSAAKDALRNEIHGLQKEIGAALNAPRVPDRIINGDAIAAMAWKDAMERGTSAAYHCANEPSARMTVEKLAAVKTKLARILASLV